MGYIPNKPKLLPYNDGSDAFAYNLINNNKVYDLEFLPNKIEELENCNNDNESSSWFPTVIWNDELKQVNNTELKEYVVKLKAQDEQGKVARNHGGWQSKSFEILDPNDPIVVEKSAQLIQRSY